MPLVNNQTYFVLFNFFSSGELLIRSQRFIKQVIALLLIWCIGNMILGHIYKDKCSHAKTD